MGTRRRNGDEKDNKRVFGWGIAIVVLLLLLAVIYNMASFKRDGPLPKPEATPPAAVQPSKPAS